MVRVDDHERIVALLVHLADHRRVAVAQRHGGAGVKSALAGLIQLLLQTLHLGVNHRHPEQQVRVVLPAGRVHQRLVAHDHPLHRVVKGEKERVAHGRRAANLERDGLLHVVHRLQQLPFLGLRAKHDADQVARLGLAPVRELLLGRELGHGHGGLKSLDLLANVLEHGRGEDLREFVLTALGGCRHDANGTRGVAAAHRAGVQRARRERARGESSGGHLG